MTDEIRIKDKVFVKYISYEKILEGIGKIAKEINRDYQGKKPLFLCILNGSFFFAADLLKEIHLTCEVSFVKLASYVGTKTSGLVKEIIGLQQPITGKDIIILEDIIDTGKTMKSLITQLNSHYPESIRVATLLFKKDALQENVYPDYCVFEVPVKFLIGYGLDYDQYGRNLRDIYILK